MTSAPRGLHFGTAGVPFSSADDSSVAGIARIKELGLDALELEFVQGVRMGLDTAARIKEKAAGLGVRLSVHAPYHINFNSADHGIRLQSRERLLKTARIGEACGARSAVFHAAFYGQGPPEKAYAAVKEELRAVMSVVRAERLKIALRIETMGKQAQFGSLDEVLAMCRDVDGLKPCLDFSHLYAREGKVNSYLDFERVLAKTARKLGVASRRPHPHRRHPLRRQGRDQAPQPRGDPVPDRGVAPGPARPRSRGHGHLREPEPRGRRGPAEKALRGACRAVNPRFYAGPAF
jgi:deoxyribonuclease-4